MTTLGTKGISTGGRVNRDGIGAVVKFTPRHGKTVMQPILGGSSYASQNSLEANFGLGARHSGTIEVLWPGGVRNRLYGVYHAERLVFPEISCSFDAEWDNIVHYTSCVMHALGELGDAGILNFRQRARFLTSALRAFREHKG